MDIAQQEKRTDWHPADIIAALRKRNTSLTAVSRQAGLSSSTLANALNRPGRKVKCSLQTPCAYRQVKSGRIVISIQKGDAFQERCVIKTSSLLVGLSADNQGKQVLVSTRFNLNALSIGSLVARSQLICPTPSPVIRTSFPDAEGC